MKKNTINRLSAILRSIVSLRVLAFFFLFVLLGFYVKPLRNLLLRSVWPRPWYSVSSADVLMMHNHEYLYTMTDINIEECSSVVVPNITYDSIHLQAYHYQFSGKSQVQLRDESHKHYLPMVTNEEKRIAMHLYLVLAEALNRTGVQHFLVDGSLLGAARYGGFIPWDDDIDIGLNFTDWQRVRQTLSCLKGYHLQTTPKMHWKFHRAHNTYPYIDVFFYLENEQYIWAIPTYIIASLLYPKDKLYPLKITKFESIQVPVPRELEEVANLVFDLVNCDSPSINHKTGVTFEVITVPCTSLLYLYPMRI